MSKAKLVPFRIAHIDLIEVREYERVALQRQKDLLEALAEQGYAGTMMHDGRSLGVIGATQLWPGVFEIFIIPSVYVAQYPLAFVKAVKNVLNSFQESHEVRRFQTQSLADELHDRWMKYIGFECEGTLKKYTLSGEDCRMWARLYHGF